MKYNINMLKDVIFDVHVLYWKLHNNYRKLWKITQIVDFGAPSFELLLYKCVLCVWLTTPLLEYRLLRYSTVLMALLD